VGRRDGSAAGFAERKWSLLGVRSPTVREGTLAKLTYINRAFVDFVLPSLTVGLLTLRRNPDQVIMLRALPQHQNLTIDKIRSASPNVNASPSTLDLSISVEGTSAKMSRISLTPSPLISLPKRTSDARTALSNSVSPCSIAVTSRASLR